MKKKKKKKNVSREIVRTLSFTHSTKFTIINYYVQKILYLIDRVPFLSRYDRFRDSARYFFYFPRVSHASLHRAEPHELNINKYYLTYISLATSSDIVKQNPKDNLILTITRYTKIERL